MKPGRKTSFGQKQRLTPVDWLGVFLSGRMISHCLRGLAYEKISLLDIGCGYQAGLLTRLSPKIRRGIGIDVAIAPPARAFPNLSFYEQPAETAMRRLKGNSLEVITCISVMEHFAEPAAILRECARVLKPGGRLILNVPTWAGKYFLEKSAYVFKLSPADEMDDHKMYYTKRDLWPLLVQAGFKPSAIRLRYHKFGLNLYAVCQKALLPNPKKLLV